MTPEQQRIESLERRVAELERKMRELGIALRSGGFSSMTISGLASSLSAAARAIGGGWR